MSQSSGNEIASKRPRVAEAAFAIVCVAALVSLAFAVVLPFQIQHVIDAERSAKERGTTTIAELQQQLTIGVIIACAIAVLFAAALLWFGFRFRAGRRRGRFWIVVLTAIALAPVLLTQYTLLTVAILVVADALMFLPSVTRWIDAVEKAANRARLAAGITRA
jgi:hypothetical protein